MTRKYPVSKDEVPERSQTYETADSLPALHVQTPAPNSGHVETDGGSTTEDYDASEYNVPIGNGHIPIILTDKACQKTGVVEINSYVLHKKKGILGRACCKLCGCSCSSVKALLEHHHTSHGIHFCQDCNKGFNTQTALDKHRYLQKDLKLICETCGKSYLFQSRLDQHKYIHRNVCHHCMFQNCKKFFKTVGDLNRHVKQHEQKNYYHCDYCTYKNLDKRNIESHMRLHVAGNERYWCSLCGKTFRFSTQHLKHK